MDLIDGSQYFPGAASLLEQLDKTILLILRDGRHFVGCLRSFDAFLNLVLEDTHERVMLAGNTIFKYALNYFSINIEHFQENIVMFPWVCTSSAVTTSCFWVKSTRKKTKKMPKLCKKSPPKNCQA